MNLMKKILLIIGALAILLAGTSVVVPKWQRHQEILEAEKLLERELPPVIDPISTTSSSTSSSSPSPNPNPSPTRAEVNLAVPFTSQAPTGNWDLPYQEACE